MKTDIILCGVGGQGILSIATVIGEAAMHENLYIKQAEVHGMSQRGGDVQSNLRISSNPIHSDLIAKGSADVIISMEPMEALRYLPYLAPQGAVITSSKPLVNIPNYPDEAALLAELDALPHVVRADIETLARESGMPKSANMILLGMAAPSLSQLLSEEQLRDAIARVFARKGMEIVNANLEAFKLGLATASNR